MATNPKSTLPDDTRKSFAIAHTASVAEQSARLLNTAYANLVNSINLSWQNAVSHQQAMFNLQMATVAKRVELIANVSSPVAAAMGLPEAMRQLLETMDRIQAANAAQFAPPQHSGTTPKDT